jgi:hypothetical protein
VGILFANVFKMAARFDKRKDEESQKELCLFAEFKWLEGNRCEVKVEKFPTVATAQVTKLLLW